MPDDNGTPTERSHGATAWDAVIELIRAVRDIFNDWRALMFVGIVVLIIANKMTGSLVFEGLEGLVRAWRGQP